MGQLISRPTDTTTGHCRQRPLLIAKRSWHCKCRWKFALVFLFKISFWQLIVNFFQLHCCAPFIGQLISLPTATTTGHCCQHPLLHSKEKLTLWVQVKIRPSFPCSIYHFESFNISFWQLIISFFQLHCCAPSTGRLISRPTDITTGRRFQRPLLHSKEKLWLRA
jgi:hypothetical protein